MEIDDTSAQGNGFPDLPPLTPEEQAQLDADFLASALSGMRKCEQEWSKRGARWAWIDPAPTWIGVAEWNLSGALKAPEQPCARVFRLSLIGGGQIKVREDFVWMETNQSPDWTICYTPALTIAAHVNNVLQRYHGTIEHFAYEMDAHAVVSRQAPQEILDRAAATFRAINGDRDNFYALLDAGTRCSFCRRPLKDEVSKLIGVGPDCAARAGIPHNMQAANKRLELRAKLLGAAP